MHVLKITLCAFIVVDHDDALVLSLLSLSLLVLLLPHFHNLVHIFLFFFLFFLLGSGRRTIR
jgi:hypothetical protein